MFLLRRCQLSLEMTILLLQVLAALVGRAPLPWAGPNKEKYRHELGQLAETVMQLLIDDPLQRATARQVYEDCNN